jgi:hypothetical protein
MTASLFVGWAIEELNRLIATDADYEQRLERRGGIRQ